MALPRFHQLVWKNQLKAGNGCSQLEFGGRIAVLDSQGDPKLKLVNDPGNLGNYTLRSEGRNLMEDLSQDKPRL